MKTKAIAVLAKYKKWALVCASSLGLFLVLLAAKVALGLYYTGASWDAGILFEWAIWRHGTITTWASIQALAAVTWSLWRPAKATLENGGYPADERRSLWVCTFACVCAVGILACTLTGGFVLGVLGLRYRLWVWHMAYFMLLLGVVFNRVRCGQFPERDEEEVGMHKRRRMLSGLLIAGALLVGFIVLLGGKVEYGAGVGRGGGAVVFVSEPNFLKTAHIQYEYKSPLWMGESVYVWAS